MARPPDPTARISLLRAAEQVFAAHGLAAAKVEDITRKAGLSKGAFYLHFESKEEAFKHVTEAFLARIGSVALPLAVADLPKSAEAMIAHWHERDTQLFEILWQDRAIVSIVAGCQGPHTYLLETFRASMDRTSKEWIAYAKDIGLLRQDLDTDLIATLLCGAYEQLSMRMLALPKKPPIADWVSHTLSALLGGMGTPRMVPAAHALARRDRRVTDTPAQQQVHAVVTPPRAAAGRR